MSQNGNSEELEFEILGHKVRFKANQDTQIPAKDIVQKLQEEIGKIRSTAPQLDKGKVAVLAALKLTSDKMILEREYQEHMSKLQDTAVDALRLIEEVSPSVM